MLNKEGFTIVELLVVIVVIGILAAITFVSYSNISNKAIAAGLQSDLDNDAKLLKLYNVEYGYYPNTLDANKCPLTPTVDNRYCLKVSADTDLIYSGDSQSFTVTVTKKSIKYRITESTSPSLWLGLTGPDWITIGTQTWAKANLNVGTMVTGVTEQTNNSILEKYCYNNSEANCTSYGGLYQWDEAMQYVTTAGAQGICPADSHIPTDGDFKTLEIQLGMTQVQADARDSRGTNQGTQLQVGGLSGLDIPFAGTRIYSGGGFGALSVGGYLWSSTESSMSAWYRAVDSGLSTVNRNTNNKAGGLSIRCVGN